MVLVTVYFLQCVLSVQQGLLSHCILEAEVFRLDRTSPDLKGGHRNAPVVVQVTSWDGSSFMHGSFFAWPVLRANQWGSLHWGQVFWLSCNSQIDLTSDLFLNGNRFGDHNLQLSVVFRFPFRGMCDSHWFSVSTEHLFFPFQVFLQKAIIHCVRAFFSAFLHCFLVLLRGCSLELRGVFFAHVSVAAWSF